MAKFTKLNIGDSVASSGGRVWKKLSSMLQLAAPTLSLDGDTLTITDDSKLATSFDIYVNGEVKGTATSTTFDLSALGLESGTYSISVIAKADGYKDSVESEAVSYEVAAAEELAGTWVLNDDLSGLDEAFVFGVNSVANASVVIGTTTYNGTVCDVYGFEVWGGDAPDVYIVYNYNGIKRTWIYEEADGGWQYLGFSEYTFNSVADSTVNADKMKAWLKANATKTA